MWKAVLLSALFAAVIGLGSMVQPYAGDVPAVNQTQEVRSGEFRYLGFWRKLKLAAAHYVNPELVERSQILYVYQPMKALPEDDLMQLVSKAASGEIGVAVQKGPDAYTVMPVAAALGTGPQGEVTSAEIQRIFATPGWSLVGVKKDLLGATTTNPIVWWGPEPTG